MIILEARSAPSTFWQIVAPLQAIAMTLLLGAVLLTLAGQPVGAVFEAFFLSPLKDSYGIAEVLLKATPLALIGFGLSLGFRAGIWNIGAEGQFVLGGIFAGAVALWLEPFGFMPGWNQIWIFALLAFAGMLGGALWAAVPAVLKVRLGVNEILVSLMLVYVAELLLSYLVHGPLRDPYGYNFPESAIFGFAETLPLLISGTRLHIGFLLVPLFMVILWAVLAGHRSGFAVKVMGDSPRAASFAGFGEKSTIAMLLLFSGAMAGLAGAMEVLGPIGQLLPDISPGYGFTAIIVAFLGRLNPIGIVFAAFLIALSYIGSETLQISAGLPVALASVFQGMLLFFIIGCDVLIRYRIRWRSAGERIAST